MTDTLQQRISRALSTVNNPRLGADVVSAEMIRDVATTTDGRVRVTLLLTAADDAALVREVRQALEQVAGVSDVRVDVRDAAESGTPAPPAAKPRRALPTMDQPAAPARVPAPQPISYPRLGRIIAVSSGKGGVGKSTVAVNIAVALAASGKRVGILDADIYGPNTPRMLGVSAPPPVVGEKIVPLEAHGVKVMSLGFLIEREQPAIWRGPIVMKIITQFLRDVEWGDLDILIVDMPPGTGDAQLSLVQATQVHGAVIVTTPQQMSTGDALRGAKMFERVGVPVFGIVENMSYFECPHCGKPTPIFGSGGGEALALELGIPLLGQVPLFPRVMQGGEEGRPIVTSDPDSGAAKALRQIADRVAQEAAERAAR